MLGRLYGSRRHDRPSVHRNFQSGTEPTGDQAGSSPLEGSTVGCALENEALNDSSVVLGSAFPFSRYGSKLLSKYFSS